MTNLSNLTKYLKVDQKNIFINVKSTYKISKDYENAIDINEVKKVIKHICNFNLILKPDDSEEIETNITTNTMLTSRFSKMSEDSDFYYFELNENENLFESNLFVKAVGNASSIFFLMIGGKIGDNGLTKYDEIYQLLYDSLNDNEIQNKPSISYELLVSEIMRDKTDLSKPFRLKINESNKDIGFIPINIREIPRMQSPVSALMSEDIFEGVVSIVNGTQAGKKDKLTPVEQIMLNKY